MFTSAPFSPNPIASPSPIAPTLYATPSAQQQAFAQPIAPTPIVPPFPQHIMPQEPTLIPTASCATQVQQVQPPTNADLQSLVNAISHRSIALPQQSVPILSEVPQQPTQVVPTVFPTPVASDAVLAIPSDAPQVPIPQASVLPTPAPIPSAALGDTSTDLYRKYRPQTLEHFHGQPAAAHSVSKWFSDPGSPCPQAILITGPSGVGKSTLARIIAHMLEATSVFDYQEINIGEENGIDLIRSLSDKVQYRSHTGKNRVFFLDETALMRGNAQQALLKILEQLPPKIYIILATTHPQKLETTVRNRCVTLALKLLANDALLTTLNTVLAAEQRTLEPEVVARLIETSAGSGRQLMTTLQRILTSDKATGQLAMLSEVDTPVEGELAKEIAWTYAGWHPAKSWTEFSALLSQLDLKATTPESLRIFILSCCKKALLDSATPERLARIIHVFRNPYYNAADPAVFLADAFFAYSVLTTPR